MGQANQPNPNVLVQPAAVAPVIALTPALLNKEFLDWTKPKSDKLYSKAIEKVDFKFEGKPHEVILLAQAIQNRAEIYGFKRTVINTLVATSILRNLITEHGLLSYIDISTSLVSRIECHKSPFVRLCY